MDSGPLVYQPDGVLIIYDSSRPALNVGFQ